MEMEKHEKNGFTQYLIEEGSGAKMPYNPKTGQMILPDGRIIKLPDDTLHPETRFDSKRLYCPVVNQTIVLEMGPNYSICTRINRGAETIGALTEDFGAKSKEDITGCNCKEFDEKVNRLLQQIQEARK